MKRRAGSAESEGDDGADRAAPAPPWKARLAALSASHAAVDCYGAFLPPIVALVLAPRLGLGDSGAARLLALHLAILSLAQPLFGYWGDRWGGRWLVVASPTVLGLAAGGFLFAGSLPLLLAQIVASALAIAAYHPEASAMAGSLAPERRVLATSLFIAVGPLGLSLGPLVVTWAAARPDPPSWLPVLGLVVSVALFRLLPQQVVRRTRLHEQEGLRAALRGRGGALGLLMALSACRYLLTNGLLFGVPLFLADRLGAESAVLAGGRWLSLYLVCNAAGGLLGSFLLRGREGRVAQPFSMAVTAVCLTGFALATDPLTGQILLAITGLAQGWTGPLVIALGQRVAPRAAAVATSLLLGLSWAVGGPAAPLLFDAVRSRQGSPEALLALAAVAGLTALLALPLPRALAASDRADEVGRRALSI